MAHGLPDRSDGFARIRRVHIQYPYLIAFHFIRLAFEGPPVRVGYFCTGGLCADPNPHVPTRINRWFLLLLGFALFVDLVGKFRSSTLLALACHLYLGVSCLGYHKRELRFCLGCTGRDNFGKSLAAVWHRHP